jgi:hypothetical protein
MVENELEQVEVFVTLRHEPILFIRSDADTVRAFFV